MPSKESEEVYRNAFGPDPVGPLEGLNFNIQGVLAVTKTDEAAQARLAEITAKLSSGEISREEAQRQLNDLAGTPLTGNE